MAEFAQPRDNHPKVFVMIDAYLDESGVHDGAPICIIAGYIGGKGQIKRLDKSWKRVLADFNFPMKDFHAKDLLKSNKHRPMLMALARAISSHKKVHPISSGVVVQDFLSFSADERRFLTGATLDPNTGKLVASGCPSKPYFVPFQNVLKTATDHAPVGGYAHFAFGCDRPFAEYALALFPQIKRQTTLGPREWSTWKSRGRLGDPSFPEAAKTASLQAADLFAHLSYVHMREWLELGKVVKASEIFGMCLKNACCTKDNRFQDKFCLDDTLRKSQEILAGFIGE